MTVLRRAAGQDVVNAVAQSYDKKATPDNAREAYIATIQEILSLLNRLMRVLERLQSSEPDDFMKGWGEPGGEMES